MNTNGEEQMSLPFDFETPKMNSADAVVFLSKKIAEILSSMSVDEKVSSLNEARSILHDVSPFKSEPVDFVKWVKNTVVTHNDYNPNKVAPPEMKLLELSIMNDGYTQPIVSWSNEDKGMIEVIDGFHRHRVGKESAVVNERVQGFLPVVDIRTEQSSKNDRMASTIRHNRARGKHQVDAMSEIVIELKNRNWRNARIARELGMDEEEVLRLCQVSGLEHLFNDADFSRAWEAQDGIDDWDDITDDVAEEDIENTRATNTNDPDRVFHTYEKWECNKAGFYASSVTGKTAAQCEQEYAEFLSDDEKFRAGLSGVFSEWVHSCEHYLTNRSMNRIAWLGQAAMCYSTGIPSKFCSGFNKLTDEQKLRANTTALEYLNKWLVDRGLDSVSMDEGLSSGRQVEIY